jgi:hypothetical protein
MSLAKPATHRVAAFKPHRLAVSLKGQDVGGHSIQEPAASGKQTDAFVMFGWVICFFAKPA